VAVPGITTGDGAANDIRVTRGGIGILVFDVAHNYDLLKRIPTSLQEYTAIRTPAEYSGITVSIPAGLLYVTGPFGIEAYDLLTEKLVWQRKPGDPCCERPEIDPVTGMTLYVGQGGPAHTTVLDAKTGALIKILANPDTVGRHNTNWTADGSKVFLAGTSTPFVSVADPKTNEVVGKIGPFGNPAMRGIATNGTGTLLFATVADFFGFEVADVKTGKVIHHVEMPNSGPGQKWAWQGKPLGHGTPSHNIAMTPDERELWITDGANRAVHIFDATVMPPVYKQSITGMMDDPSWIRFDMDGKRAYIATSEVVDVATKKVIFHLTDEYGRPVFSEKSVDVRWDNVKKVPLKAGMPYGLGRVVTPRTTMSMEKAPNVVASIRRQPVSLQRNAAEDTAAAQKTVHGMFNEGDVLAAKIAKVKLLAEPSDSARVLATLARNDEMVVVGGEQDGFIKVQSTSKSGWVKAVLTVKK
jgi:DNA-binding beta-propeller fold protein YncE